MCGDPRTLRPRIKTFANLVEERLRERLGGQRARGLVVTGEGEHAATVKVPGGALVSPLLTATVKRNLHGFIWWVQPDGRIRVLRPVPERPGIGLAVIDGCHHVPGCIHREGGDHGAA